MLGAGQRMRRRDEFTSALRAGRRARRGDLVVHLATGASTGDPNSEDHRSGARAGFIVSRAVGNAVVRNTVRRRLRHLVRGRLTGLPADALLVVRVLPGAAAHSSAELGRDLDAALGALTRRTEAPR